MNRIGVIGSCVTRDVWRVLGLPTDRIKTFSRTSFASLMAPSPQNVLLPDSLGALGRDGFLARCVRADIEKSALASLEEWRPDVLIFDFVDERFNLLLAGDSIVTDSLEFWRSGLRVRPPFLDGRAIHRLSDEAWQLWYEGLAAVGNRIARGPLATAKVVLHAASWAEFYRQDGTLKRFPKRMRLYALPRAPEERVADYVSLIGRQNDAFLRVIPGAIIVAPPDEHRIADPAHEWGLSPHHLIADYYRSFLELCRTRNVLI